MRITKIQLKNFKRFTDLTIDDISPNAKLILLIGANGCGKSSIFDSLNYISRDKEWDWLKVTKDLRTDAKYRYSYYGKNGLKPEIYLELQNKKRKTIVTTRDNNNVHLKSRFIGRSSIRIIPRITDGGDTGYIDANIDSPDSFIDEDHRFINDIISYIRLIDDSLREPVFKRESANTLDIFQSYIQPLNTSLINVLGGDEYTTMQIHGYQAPTSKIDGTLILKKGNSKINYDLLSHGEKQILILLLNFFVRKKYYEDAVIYIDEMDCHLNTKIQYRLLDEVVNSWIPDSSQLWTASHALGFIDYARKSDKAVTIDLSSLNFDIPQVLTPAVKDNIQIYDIAIPKNLIKQILKGHKLVAVENQNDQHYNIALGQIGYLFLPASNNREVYLTAKEDPNILGLRDRDYLKDEEIRAIQQEYPNLRILRYYTFENYLYYPDNLEEMRWPGFDKTAYIWEITKQKNEKIIEIVSKIAVARQSYIELRELIKNDKKIDTIISALQSDDFETFYPFFNMKTYFNKSYLHQFPSYAVNDLVKTDWFKENIIKIIKF